MFDDQKELIFDAMKLVDFVSAQGNGNPEKFAFTGVPQFEMVKEYCQCRSAQAIYAFPTIYKACMNPVRWHTIKQFACMDDERFERYISRLEQKDYEAENAKENKKYETRFRDLFHYIAT